MLGEKYKTTRSQLLELKKRRELIRRGHDVLERKRKALVARFLALLKTTRELRREVNAVTVNAYRKLEVANAVDGSLEVASASLAVKSRLSVEVSRKRLAGVVVPNVRHGGGITHDYALIGTSARVDEASMEFALLVELILQLAECEVALRKILEELGKIKRRVNALEHVKIPENEEALRFVEAGLAEIERDNFFRLKLVKKKIIQATTGGK